MPLNIRALLSVALAVTFAIAAPVTPAGAKHRHVVSHSVHRVTTSRSTHRSSHARTAQPHVASRAQGRGKHSAVAVHSHRGRYGRVSRHVVARDLSSRRSYPEPHADNVQNSSTLSSVYRLYDRGVNERLAGRYEDATKTLLQASNSYSSNQKGLTLEAMIDYELAQAADACNNYQVAADAYERALRIKPTMVEASVKMSSMLMRTGLVDAAVNRARQTVANNPNDPRAHQILALILEKTGLNDDAKRERNSAKQLVKSPVEAENPSANELGTAPGVTGNTDSSSVIPAQLGRTDSSSVIPTQPGRTGSSSVIPVQPGRTNSSSVIPAQPEAVKSPTEPVDNDVMP